MAMARGCARKTRVYALGLFGPCPALSAPGTGSTRRVPGHRLSLDARLWRAPLQLLLHTMTTDM